MTLLRSQRQLVVGDIACTFMTPTPVHARWLEDSLGEETLLTLFANSLRPGDIFWDVGAHIGVYTMIASKIVGPEGKVYAFEPEPRLSADLIENCHLNRTDNVEVLPVALSNEDQETTLYTDRRAALGIHKLFSEPRLGQHGVTVKAQSGDTLVKTGTAAQPSVVKVDVEGWEIAVLEGMAATLGDASCRLLLLEVHSYYLHNLGYDVDDLRTLIEGFGFQIVHEDIRHTIQETGIKAEQRHWICQKGEQATNSA